MKQWRNDWMVFWIAILCLTLCWACRKEKDERKPEVVITHPYENQSFTFGDSIYIAGSATDETHLTSIIVALTDIEYIVKDYQVNVSVDGNRQEFSFWYFPSNPEIAGADAYIQVRASDDVNTKYKYRKINIGKPADSLRNVVLITEDNTSSFSLYTLDSTFTSPVFRGQWSHPFAGSAVSESAHQLYLLGQGFGQCYAIDTEDFKLDFVLPQDGTPSPFYHEGIVASRDRFYLGLTEGYVKGYNPLGTQQFLTELLSGRKPGVMTFHQQQYLIMTEYERNGNGAWISASFLSGGMPWKQYKLPDGFQTTRLFSRNNDEILVFGNLAGVGKVFLWNIYANSISDITPNWSDKIRDVVPQGNDRFLIANDQGVILYQPLNQNTSPILYHSGISSMALDEVSNSLFVASLHQLSVYSMSTLQIVSQISLSHPVAAFHLVF